MSLGNSGMNRSEDDPGHLDDINEILRKPNLCHTLESLAPLGIFTDPVIGMPYPMDTTDESDSLSLDLRKYVQLWQIAYFAKIALQKSNPYRRDEFDSKKLREVINHYNIYDAPCSEDLSSEEYLQVSIRIAYQQFPFQRKWYDWMNITHHMFRENPVLNQMVIDLFGVRYELLVDICLCLYMAICTQIKTHKRKSFSFNDLMTLLPWYDEDILRGIIDAITQSQDEFRKECDDRCSGDRYLGKYDFNPLLSKPIVRINGRYYIPVPAAIPLWCIEGIQYRLSAYAKDISNRKESEFFYKFGHAFEDFVEDQFARTRRQYIRVDDVLKNRKRADFILLEGDTALIIDCKTKRRVLKHRYGIIEAIDKDYNEVIHGLDQCINTEKSIRDGILKSLQYPDIQNITSFSYMIVTLGDFYLANSCFMQDRVREKLGMSIQYQVISARELELILANVDGDGIASFITEKSLGRCPMPESYESYLPYHFANRDGYVIKDPSKDIFISIAERLKERVKAMQHLR